MDNEEYILNCKFAFKCPETWDALERTEEDGVRYCNACERTVTFIRSQADRESAAAQGKCVAANVRSEGFDYPRVATTTSGMLEPPPPVIDEPASVATTTLGKLEGMLEPPPLPRIR